jgi:uncharacterized OB-fold protein
MSETIWQRPTLDPWNRPFWEAASAHRLVLQRCVGCQALRYPPGPSCRDCLSTDFQWEQASGRGTVSAWVVFHQSYFSGAKELLPYNVAIVDLDEGVPFMSNIVGIQDSEIRAGIPVEVTFDDVEDGLSIPRFRPLES